MNDQVRRRRHTGTHEQGSEVRIHRIWSLTRAKETLFPVQFCALDSAFGSLCAATYTSEVQQGPGGFLQLLVELYLYFTPCPLASGPLDSRWTPRGLVDAPLIPEIRIFITVETLAAGTARLPAFTASFIQRGQGGGGGTGGAALQSYTAVVMVLLWIAAHQHRVGSGEVQWAVRIAWVNVVPRGRV